MDFLNEVSASWTITWDGISVQSSIFMDLPSLNIFSLLYCYSPIICLMISDLQWMSELDR